MGIELDKKPENYFVIEDRTFTCCRIYHQLAQIRVKTPDLRLLGLQRVLDKHLLACTGIVDDAPISVALYSSLFG